MLVVHLLAIYILEEDEHTKSRYIHQIFENNKEYDHGLYTPVKEFRDELMSRLKAFKQIKI